MPISDPGRVSGLRWLVSGKVQVFAVEARQALDIGRSGDAGVLFVHGRDAELPPALSIGAESGVAVMRAAAAHRFVDETG